MDCIATIPCDDGSRARATMTKVENAKKMPAIHKQKRSGKRTGGAVRKGLWS
ncbi:hypothetical protein [Paenibacillus sp. 32352]|uniref:hypothetical protein n=1 Tax=Paenibacillus sp. 32352 TaxID=1969111 RepID=UPI0015C41A49|nr:hypothetical protein [Paenibacillus sp. 32352]